MSKIYLNKNLAHMFLEQRERPKTQTVEEMFEYGDTVVTTTAVFRKHNEHVEITTTTNRNGALGMCREAVKIKVFNAAFCRLLKKEGVIVVPDSLILSGNFQSDGVPRWQLEEIRDG